MRVSVLRAAGDLEVQERPDPDLSPHEVWVRVSSVGVCGSDIHYFEHGRIGRFTVDAPLVLGHEASGEVVRLGSAVSRLTLGQRVSLEPGVPDFTCSQCLAGRYNLCTGMRFFATPPIDGAFAELVTIHEQFAHPVPDHLSDDAAAMLEPLSVGLWACRRAEVTAGSRVLITGAGPVGLVTAQCALALGASEVTVTDVNRHRLQLARDLGVTTTVDTGITSLADSGVEPDVLLECSGRPEGGDVKPLLDESWFLPPDDKTRVDRLIQRHIDFGKSPQAARDWFQGSDRHNGDVVVRTRHLADVLVIGGCGLSVAAPLTDPVPTPRKGP